MKKFVDLAKFALTVLLMGTTVALAVFDPVNDDTDIFLANPSIAAERPNVLLVVDNTANWNGPFTNEKNALVQVINGLTDQYNVGLMIMSDANIKRTGPTASDGSYVRYHVRQMTATNKVRLSTIINNFDIQNDKGDNNLIGMALYEAYLYFGGKASRAGDDQFKADHDGTADTNLTPLTGHALPGPDGTGFPNSGGLYRSPVVDGCARNFIIYISNGPANENANQRAELEGYLGALTGVTPPATISISPSGQQSNWADEMAKFMANADVFATSASVPNSSGVQNIYSYTVEVDPSTAPDIITVKTAVPHGFAINAPVTISGTTNYNGNYTVNAVISTTEFRVIRAISPTPATEITGTVNGVAISEIKQTNSDMTALLKSVAVNGKGKYFGVTSGASGTAIVDALNAIFSEVQAVNSVFASTTLPVSVNVRGTNLNQVYIGVFRPDANKSPRWLGNLKMYNLAFNSVTSTVFLADAANGPPPAVGNAAENSSTGFVSPTSPSFWTTASTYWGFRDATQNGPGGASDYADGDLVEKGGAAQQLRIHFANAEASVTPRKLYTCTTGNVSGVLQTCATNSLLSNTPFTTLNDAISAAALQLDTRFVSPLTAFETKPVAALTDRRVASISNANPGLTVNVVTMSNGATTRTITNLTTSTPLVIPSPPTGGITSDVSGAQTRSITSIVKLTGNTWVAQAGGALPSAYIVGATVSFSGFANTNWNGVSFSITAVNGAANTFQFSRTGNPGDGATGTAAVAATIPSTTAVVTFPGHGFASGASVTIAGATPNEYNTPVPVGITVQDANHFTYTLTSAPTTTGNATGTITVSGNTTTATATFAAAHGFLHGTTVTISGASNAAYNGPKTISCTAGNCTGQTTFTYSVGGTPIGPNTASPVYAVQGGGTTVTVTTTTAHGFLDGDSVSISGSDITGYNGTWRISCPGGCFPVPPFPGAPPAAPTVFTFNTAIDNVAPTAAITSPLPANNSGTVTASLAGATISTVTATVANHGYTAGSSVVIESTSTPANTVHPGTFIILAVLDANTFTYSTGAVLVAPTGTFTARPPTLSSRAIATVTGHGYAAGQEVTIKSAVPTAYNGAKTITRVVDANSFEYAMTSAPGANTSATATASIKTTTAKATAVNHGFADGSTVTVAGATPGAFNGSFVISVTGTGTFRYTIPSAQGDATGTITAGQATGVSAERDLIIRWVRGEDNFEDENINSSTADVRASVHGDVLHSRPAVVNYNRFASSDDDVFIFYGGNDGIFHAVKGGYAVPTGDVSGLTPGKEAWGFVASEFFGQLRRLRNNSPAISSSFKRPYFMDGPIGVHTVDANGNGKLGDAGDKVNLYIANRRGGRFLYALDVNTPTAPKFLWKIDTSTTGFSELGYTWSQPTVVPDLLGLTTPLLVFGAGYDPVVEDIDPASITLVDTTTGAVKTAAGTSDRSMGRGIYVADALTGALVWSAGGPGSGATVEVPDMIYAIPSDVTIIRNETTGIVNRGYVGDTGGQMWRIDFRQDTSAAALLANPNNLNLTTVTKIGSIADQTTAAGRRKFLFPPDVVGETGYDAILIGSGDREHPFDTTVTNRFYMFKDKGNDVAPLTGTTACEPAITEGAIPDPSDACAPNPGPIPGMSDLTSNCLQDASACLAGESQSGVSTKLGTDRGWYITLGAGEKVVGNAVSIAGTTFFNTNQPSATAGGGTCGSNLGIARQYQVATVDATATSDLNAVGGLTGADRSLIHAGGGYLPSPVHVVVMLDGKPVEAVISGVQVSTPAGASLSARLRKFWYKEVDFK